MKNRDCFSLFFIALLIGFLLSCQSNPSKKVNFFAVKVVVLQDLKLNKDEPLESSLRSIFNYQKPENCPDKLFVPEVTVVREDLGGDQIQKIPLFLSSLNSWKSKDWVPARNLMEDYDNLLKSANNPEILTKQSDQIISLDDSRRKYPDGIYIPFSKRSSGEMFEIINKEVYAKLCENTQSSFTLVLFFDEEVIPPGDDHSGDLRDLKSALRRLIDLNASLSERTALIPEIVENFFSENASIEEFGENKTRVGAKSPETYLKGLVMYRSIESVEILDAKKNPDGKYWTVQVVEHHKLTQ